MNKSIIETAKKVLQMESTAVLQLQQYLDDDFVRCLDVILHCKGRVIVTGIGKSAIIAQKIVATFNC